MSLGQVLVFADENNDPHPKLFCLMLPQSLSNHFCFANVCARRVSLWVVADEHIDSGLVELLASQKVIKFRARRGNSLSGPIRNLSGSKTFRVSAWKKESDGCRCHAHFQDLRHPSSRA